MLRRWTRLLGTSLAPFVLFAGSAFASGTFLVEPGGQATGSTCQSYALAVALATKNDPSFNIVTAADLRKTEESIRAEIKKASGTFEVSHAHIQIGLQKFTKGRYALKFTEVREADIGDFVARTTGITSAVAVPASFLVGALVKDVVLASASRIGMDAYSAGHIFAIYAVDGPPNSNRQYLILNSGVKIKEQRYTCESNLPDDPGDYSALLGWKKSADISFKHLTGDYVRLWSIERTN